MHLHTPSLLFAIKQFKRHEFFWELILKGPAPVSLCSGLWYHSPIVWPGETFSRFGRGSCSGTLVTAHWVPELKVAVSGYWKCWPRSIDWPRQSLVTSYPRPGLFTRPRNVNNLVIQPPASPQQSPWRAYWSTDSERVTKSLSLLIKFSN